MKTNSKKILLDGCNLTIESIYQYSMDNSYQFAIDPKAREKVLQSRKLVLDVVESQVPTYGINTGFGALANKHIEKADLTKLQINLIRSHCVGVGEPLATSMVRSMMLILVQSLLKGYSGIQLEAIELIVEMLNHDITPIIPEKGSVGASGDLAPLAHLASCLIGEGDVLYQGKRQNSLSIFHELKLEPLLMGPKDGLALINGTHLMAAMAVHAVIAIENLVKNADLACAMSLDGLRGSLSAFDPDLHALKAHGGQVATAKNVVDLLQGSTILESHQDCDRIQDPYSIRCAPQVHGAIRQTLQHAKDILNQELQSVTDNPIVLAQKKKIISGGHFHGQALAFVLDYLALGVCELCSISERRVVKLLNPEFSKLPAFLATASGLQSGLMITQYTAASLVSENKVFAHPASVDSVPTSNDKEDHVSMGPNAGRKLMQIISNAHYCLAIEFLCSSQALYLLRPLHTSKPIEKALDVIWQASPPITQDRVFAKNIEDLKNLVVGETLLQSTAITFQ